MTWGGKQMIAHLTSSGDLSKWTFKGFVEVVDQRAAFTGVDRRAFFGPQASEALATTSEVLTKVIDADVRLLPDGRWKIWFKDLKIPGGGTTAAAISTDASMTKVGGDFKANVIQMPSHGLLACASGCASQESKSKKRLRTKPPW